MQEILCLKDSKISGNFVFDRNQRPPNAISIISTVLTLSSPNQIMLSLSFEFRGSSDIGSQTNECR